MSSELLSHLETAVHRLEAVAKKLEGMGLPAGGASAGAAHHDDGKGAAAEVSPNVVEFDEYLNANVVPFVDNCNHLEALRPIGHATDDAFKFMRKVVDASTKCKKPPQGDFMKFLEPLGKIVGDAQNADNRSPVFNHQKAFGEAIQLVNWVLIPAPVGHITGTLEAAEFYLNKILTQAKDLEDPDKSTHRAFVSGLKNIVNHLAEYVKAHYKTGLEWNPKGTDLAHYSAGAGGASAAPAAAGGAPPPPPPVDPNVKIELTSSAPAGGAKPGGMAAVFGELSKGEAITSGLKKVTSEMKAKNMKDIPTLQPKEKGGSGPSGPKHAEKRDPRLELRQGTWFCEYYENDIEIPEAEMKQNVYVLKARNCTISIPPKVKSIQLDGCFKTRISFSSVVSTFEIVNSERVTVYINEQCPNVALDKCSGIQIWLNDKSVAEPPVIITSNVTEVNLVVPGKTPEDDPVELALPQQFQTNFKNGKLVTEPVAHSAA